MAELKRQFKERETRKSYRALVQGVPDPPAGTVDKPIGRHAQHRRKMTIREDGRESVTHYETERAFGDVPAALLRVRIETGRTHQIRVHMASLGHGVVGDTLYGGTGAASAPRQMLHAASLGLRHPATGEDMELVAPLPEDFREVLGQVGGLAGLDQASAT